MLDSVVGGNKERDQEESLRGAYVAIALEISCPEVLQEKTYFVINSQETTDSPLLVSACHHVWIEAPADCWYVFLLLPLIDLVTLTHDFLPINLGYANVLLYSYFTEYFVIF